MALIQNEDCIECGKITLHINGKCRDCESNKASRARREHFGKLDALTLEERIRRLEEIEYNDSINPFIDPTY